jgi:hypothetical protein
MTTRTLLMLGLLGGFFSVGMRVADELADAFAAPPDSAKVWTYWW